VRKLIDQGPFSTQEALDAHLVDHIGYREDAVAAARSRAGENAQLVSLSRYLDRAGRPHQSRPTIAVVLGAGLISPGNNSSNPLSGMTVLGADALANAFRKAAEDQDVRAILFRIDSPGGSASASEAIWRETLRAKEAGKPVIVSMSNVAGSGGYYIAAAADKIVAEPATLTGSIGVVAGKMLIGGLSSTLGVTWDSAQVGKQADMYSPIRDFTPAEHDRFERMLDSACPSAWPGRQESTSRLITSATFVAHERPFQRFHGGAEATREQRGPGIAQDDLHPAIDESGSACRIAS